MKGAHLWNSSSFKIFSELCEKKESLQEKLESGITEEKRRSIQLRLREIENRISRITSNLNGEIATL